MSDIETNLQTIITAVHGRDVRQAIHDAIHDCYEDGKAGSTDLVARERISEIVTDSTGSLSGYSVQTENITLGTLNQSGSNYNYTGSKTFANNVTIIDVVAYSSGYGAGIPISYKYENKVLTATATVTYAFQNGIDATIVFLQSEPISLTELTDIRVGEDGTVYDTAGDAVREQINDLKSQITNSMPREVKLALDTMLLNMVVKDDDVFRDEYNTFHTWAYAVNLLSISAVFDSGTDTIYTDDSLDDLKQYLTVTASYDDGTSSEVSGYTLSGELTEGTSTITVAYNDKTASFDVAVVAPLYKVPNLDVTTTYDGRTNHITNSDGLFTVSGAGYHVSAIGKNGTAQVNHHTEEWFKFNSGDNVVFEVYDITWQNNAGTNVDLACKWGQTTSDSNVATATFTMASGGTGTGGSAKFELNPYTNTRSISGLVIQLVNNQGNGCEASFRIKLFVNGTRYF